MRTAARSFHQRRTADRRRRQHCPRRLSRHEGQVSLVTGVTGARGSRPARKPQGALVPRSHRMATASSSAPGRRSCPGHQQRRLRLLCRPRRGRLPSGSHRARWLSQRGRMRLPGRRGSRLPPPPPATEVVRGTPQQAAAMSSGGGVRGIKKKTKGKAKRHHREHRDRAGADRGTGR